VFVVVLALLFVVPFVQSVAGQNPPKTPSVTAEKGAQPEVTPEATSTRRPAFKLTPGTNLKMASDLEPIGPDDARESRSVPTSVIFLVVLLVSSLLANVGLLVKGSRSAPSKTRPPLTVSQETRFQPAPIQALSQKNLQDLKESIEASFRKDLKKFGEALVAELSPRGLLKAPSPERSEAGTPRPTAWAPAPSLSAVRPQLQSIQQYVDDFCRREIDSDALIVAAEKLGLRWGSATPKQGQQRVSITFENSDSRILVIQKEPGSGDYFLVLKETAFWSFDLVLLFEGRAPGGGRASDARTTRTLTKKPSIGQLEGNNELSVRELGVVEVVEG
jgi:hypothetical protein